MREGERTGRGRGACRGAGAAAISRGSVGGGSRTARRTELTTKRGTWRIQATSLRSTRLERRRSIAPSTPRLSSPTCPSLALTLSRPSSARFRRRRSASAPRKADPWPTSRQCSPATAFGRPNTGSSVGAWQDVSSRTSGGGGARDLASGIEMLAGTGVASWIRFYLHVLRVLGNESAHERDWPGQPPTHVEAQDVAIGLFCLQRVRSTRPPDAHPRPGRESRSRLPHAWPTPRPTPSKRTDARRQPAAAGHTARRAITICTAPTATAAAASQNANEAASRPQNTLSIPDHTSQGPPTDPDGERPG